MKKQRWTQKPITWGGYLKLCGVCYIISMMIAAFYWCAAFEIHPIRSIKGTIQKRFGKSTDNTEE